MTDAGRPRHQPSALPPGFARRQPSGTVRPPLMSEVDRMVGGPLARRSPGVPHGLSTRSVIERRLSGNRDDDAFLVIAVEGGGLRGVISGAMLIALDDLGITRVADAIVGTSAGAINVAYLAAGRTWDALSAYYDLLPTHLVRPAHEALRGPLLRMDFLDELFTRHRPLPPEQLGRHPVPVFATVTDVDQQCTTAVALTGDVDVHTWLKASSWLPVLAGRPLRVDGRRWLDGGVLCPNLATAGDLFQATHVLSVCSRADTAEGPSVGERLVRPVLNHWSAGLGDRFLAARQQWAADAAQLGAYTDALHRGTRVLRMTPRPHRVGRLTRDVGLLLDGARCGYAPVIEYFGGQSRCHFGVGDTEHRRRPAAPDAESAAMCTAAALTGAGTSPGGGGDAARVAPAGVA
jgi:hypothetical protein